MSIKNLLSNQTKSDQELKVDSLSLNTESVTQEYSVYTTATTTKSCGTVRFDNLNSFAAEGSYQVTLSNPLITANSTIFLIGKTLAITTPLLSCSVNSQSNGSALINLTNNSTVIIPANQTYAFNYLIIN
jgi:hypothetical protein